MIHYKGKKLPNKRVELYDVSTETFLEYWVQLRMDDASQLKDKNEIIEILAPIAFEIHQNKSNALLEEKEFVESFLWNFKNMHSNTTDEDAQRECREFINFLRQQAGFFYEKGVDDEGNSFYGFIHLTFEEYLAAIELASKWTEGELDLKDYVFNPRWTEIIRLAAAQLRLSYKGRTGRKKSTQFVEDILSVEDPFPEAYRPLQLVCMILSDDVNITDELLNGILDKIIEVASKTDFAELNISFSNLFNEILYSDYRNVFIDRFEKEVITDNSTLMNNIIYILASNSWDRAINDVLTSLYNKNEEISKAIYRIDFGSFSIKNFEVCKNNLMDYYLSYFKSQNDEGEFKKAAHNFKSMIKKISPYSFMYGLQKTISRLDQFLDTYGFDIILTPALEHSLCNYLRYGRRLGRLGTFLQRYADNTLVKNLNKSLNQINSNDIHLTYHDKDLNPRLKHNFELGHYTVLLLKGEDLYLWFWSRSFDELFYHSVSVTDISSYPESLKSGSKFSESDIEIIEREIYFILGPQEGADTENTTRFINAYERGRLYDFFDWEWFPLANIASNPSILSKIIVQYGRRYLRRRILKERINLKDFDNEHICPPAKLLAYHLLNEPYDQKLLEESIAYFRGCSSEEKKGAFSILYVLLNPFELA
jgi:hypothetical protein